MSQDNRYLGALYVNCLDAFPLRQDERIEITRIASYISIFLANAGTVPQENNGVPPNGDPPEFEIVFEDPAPMYRFDQKKQRPALEQVPSTLEGMVDSVVFGIFYDIEAAIAGGVCLAVPSRPGHFVRYQRPADFEIDKEIICRAFTGKAKSVSNADGTVWAVPIAGCEGKLGVVYSWPGNVRRLENTIVHALGNGDLKSAAITVGDLPEWFRGTDGQAVEDEITPQRFRDALAQAKQNRTRAAQILRISRAQFYRLMKKIGSV